MTISTRSGSSPNPLARIVTDAGRRIIGNRFGLLAIAAFVIGLGLILNWSWLVAAGIAPIILSLLPCVVMCALGLCMVGMGGRSKKQLLPDGAASAPTLESTSPAQFAAPSDSSDGAAASADRPAAGESPSSPPTPETTGPLQLAAPSNGSDGAASSADRPVARESTNTQVLLQPSIEED